MTEAALKNDFQPQPRGIAVVTSVPISSIVEHGHYAAFQDLVDGYASSFEKVCIVSPSGKSVITPNKPARISWVSGPGRLSSTSGLWWAAFANRRELRKVELVRSFGPRAGIIGRALSRSANAPHVSSTDDLASNSWLEKSGWQALVARIVNRFGILSADVLSATFDWELEYLADTGYMGDLLLGSRGLPTDIYTPVGTTDPARHPVVLWAGDVITQESGSVVAEVASATQKLIPNVEFVVVATGEAADRLRSISMDDDLPLTVVSREKVEPLVDLVERTWVCVTVPVPGQNFPPGLAMLALSAGIPLISVGDLPEDRGFKSHLNYIRVHQAESEEVAYTLQLLRRWSSFAYRIGITGQKLVEERYSTRSVALIEGERLARIAAETDVEVAMSIGARALEATVERLSLEDTAQTDEIEIDSAPDSSDSVPEAVETHNQGFDMVAAALASANGETESDDSAGSQSDQTAGNDMIAALFDNQVESVENAVASEPTGDDVNEVLPEIKLVEFNINDVPIAETDDGEDGDLDQDAISALFANGDSDDNAA